MDKRGNTIAADQKAPSQWEQQIADQAILLQVSQRLASSFDLTRTMPYVAESARQVVQADVTRIVLPTSSGRQTYGSGTAADALVDLDQHALGIARENGQVTITDLPNSSLPSANQFDTVGVWPLQGDSRLLGVLWLGYKKPHGFTQGERDTLTALCEQTAIAIANARAFYKAQNGRKWLEAILSSTADPVLVVDRENRISLLNHAAEDLLGIGEDSAIDQPVADVLAAHPRLLRFFTDEADLAEDEEWESPDGRAFSPRLSRVETGEGQSGGFVLTLRDITPFKLLNRNQAEFVRLVSHDLRSPLTYMQGFASLLSMAGELNERQTGFVDKVLSGISQMTTLVDNIQDAGRWDPQTGFYEMSREPSDVTATVRDIVATHQEVARKQGVTLSSTIAPNIPIVNIDNLMIERGLINLVGNAIKYSPNGGIVNISVEVKNGAILICVSDTGLGIAPEHLDQLFKRGARIVTQEIKEARIKGSGLGLFIVRSVARRHGGDVWVESELGKGSRFYFSIPLSGPNLLGGGR